jgi:hypothetical protein
MLFFFQRALGRKDLTFFSLSRAKPESIVHVTAALSRELTTQRPLLKTIIPINFTVILHISLRLKFFQIQTNKLHGFSPQARAIPIERLPLVGGVSANVAERGCRVVSATNPHSR